MATRWGIMGTGRMARALCAAIRDEGGEVVAVSSSSRVRAQQFAADHEVPSAHDRHHDLLAGHDLDAVYVATTNDRHHADALACLDAGIPVLVEKPFTLDLPQAREVVELARTRGVFLMEAMWMRFQPAFLEVERRIERGEIGTPRLVTSDLGFAASADPSGRLFGIHLGGGSLLDVGVYPLTLAISFLGAPTATAAVARLDPAGVDTQASVVMRHEQGTSAWSSTLETDSGMEATVGGSEGSLRLESPFHHSARITRRQRGRVVEELEVAGADLGYRLEVREVHRCLDAGELESPRMPWELTCTVMSWLDHIRRQAGVRYPHERGV
jgi:predicted dehydrogenase